MLFEFNSESTEFPQGIVLIDFYSHSCGPCKMLDPILEKISEDFNVVKVCVDDFPEIAATWRVRNLPTIFIANNTIEPGNVLNYPESAVDSIVGLTDATTIRNKLNEAAQNA